MRWLFSSILVLVWTAVVAARSFTGNRLLVVLEEQSEREKYSVFLEDLSGKFKICLLSGGRVGLSVGNFLGSAIGRKRHLEARG